MLAVVEDEDGRPLAEELDEPGHRLPGRPGAAVERLQHGVRYQRGFRQLVQFHPPDAARRRAYQLLDRAPREPALAHPGDPRQGDQPMR